jgi:hypothetical protein
MVNRSLTLTMLVLSLSGTAAFAAPVTLLRGAKVKICLSERVASGDSQPGAPVPMEMAEDVLGPQKQVLIAKGTPVVGFIERSKGEGSLGKPGSLAFTIKETTAVDGTKVPLDGTISRRGRNNAWALGWNLFARGNNVKLKKGKQFTAILAEETVIDPDKKQDRTATSTPAPGKMLTFTLKNGDKITGTMDGLADGVYHISTKAGALKISAADVSGISGN